MAFKKKRKLKFDDRLESKAHRSQNKREHKNHRHQTKTVSLFDDPDFDFKDKYVDITGSNGSTVKYFYSEPSLLTVPTKDVKMPESVVSIELTEEAFGELKKAAAVLNLSDLSICSTDGSSIVAILSDIKNNTSNTY